MLSPAAFVPQLPPRGSRPWQMADVLLYHLVDTRYHLVDTFVMPYVRSLSEAPSFFASVSCASPHPRTGITRRPLLFLCPFAYILARVWLYWWAGPDPQAPDDRVPGRGAPPGYSKCPLPTLCVIPYPPALRQLASLHWHLCTVSASPAPESESE